MPDARASSPLRLSRIPHDSKTVRREVLRQSPGASDRTEDVGFVMTEVGFLLPWLLAGCATPSNSLTSLDFCPLDHELRFTASAHWTV